MKIHSEKSKCWFSFNIRCPWHPAGDFDSAEHRCLADVSGDIEAKEETVDENFYIRALLGRKHAVHVIAMEGPPHAVGDAVLPSYTMDGSMCRIPVTCAVAKVNLSCGSQQFASDTDEELVCNSLEVNLSGNSMLSCTCDETITGNLSGGSALYYSGSADTSRAYLTGGSRIIHRME